MNTYTKLIAQVNMIVPFYNYEVHYRIINEASVLPSNHKNTGFLSPLKNLLKLSKPDTPIIPLTNKYYDYTFYYDDPEETEAERISIVTNDKSRVEVKGGNIRNVLDTLTLGKDYVLEVKNGTKVYKPYFNHVVI